MRYYDPKHNRLIYLAEHATPDFWDRHWETTNLRREITRKHHDFLVLPPTRDYLPPGSRVLEGGCGTGVHVYNLQRHGYQSVGIDNAPETVRRAKEAVPEMDIREGDVRALPFPDNHFDGYWSIGVIEHFWNGYDDVLREMHRVLKPGGYLFLTFPYMSPLRKWKARHGRYPLFTETTIPSSFYQFALGHHGVAETFKQNGFELIEKKPFDGWNGLRQETKSKEQSLTGSLTGRAGVGPGRASAGPGANNTLCAKLFRLAIDFLARPFAGHTILLVLQKQK